MWSKYWWAFYYCGHLNDFRTSALIVINLSLLIVSSHHMSLTIHSADTSLYALIHNAISQPSVHNSVSQNRPQLGRNRLVCNYASTGLIVTELSSSIY